MAWIAPPPPGVFLEAHRPRRTLHVAKLDTSSRSSLSPACVAESQNFSAATLKDDVQWMGERRQLHMRWHWATEMRAARRALNRTLIRELLTMLRKSRNLAKTSHQLDDGSMAEVGVCMQRTVLLMRFAPSSRASSRLAKGHPTTKELRNLTLTNMGRGSCKPLPDPPDYQLSPPP